MWHFYSAEILSLSLFLARKAADIPNPARCSGPEDVSQAVDSAAGAWSTSRLKIPSWLCCGGACNSVALRRFDFEDFEMGRRMIYWRSLSRKSGNDNILNPLKLGGEVNRIFSPGTNYKKILLTKGGKSAENVGNDIRRNQRKLSVLSTGWKGAFRTFHWKLFTRSKIVF